MARRIEQYDSHCSFSVSTHVLDIEFFILFFGVRVLSSQSLKVKHAKETKERTGQARDKEKIRR